MAASIAVRLASLVTMRLAVPLRVEALAEMTPGSFDRDLAIRRSHAVQVIPATAMVMSSFGRRPPARGSVVAVVAAGDSIHGFADSEAPNELGRLAYALGEAWDRIRRG